MVWLVLALGLADAWSTDDHQYSLKVTLASASYTQESVASPSFLRTSWCLAREARRRRGRCSGGWCRASPGGSRTEHSLEVPAPLAPVPGCLRLPRAPADSKRLKCHPASGCKVGPPLHPARPRASPGTPSLTAAPRLCWSARIACGGTGTSPLAHPYQTARVRPSPGHIPSGVPARVPKRWAVYQAGLLPLPPGVPGGPVPGGEGLAVPRLAPRSRQRPGVL